MSVLTDKKRSGMAGPPRWFGGFGGGDESDDGSRFPVSKGQLAIWLLLTAATMLFAGLTSAYIVLRGVPSWQNVALPPLLWVNTFVLVASSVALEVARHAVRHGRQRELRLWLAFSGLLGIGFLVGQVIVWRQLVAAGVYLPSTLHSSFFYVLTGIHGVHLIGGVAGLGYVLRRAFQGHLGPARYEHLKLCALYWHFMDVVWIYLFALLVFA